MPRVDYLNNSNGSLILEPQRSNLVTYSSDFSQWGNARTTDTSNQITSPDGLNEGTLLEQQSGQTNAGSIYLGGLGLSSGTYAQSIFAKKKDKDFIVCYSANAERTYFNLSNGTIGTIASGNTAKIEDYGNGWYRCTITYTITSGGVIAFYLSDSDNSSVVTDSGGVYIYGAMLEQGSYSTSIINTSGSTVTRNQDTCSITNVADRINSSEGVFYFEGSSLASSTSALHQISLSDGSGNNRVMIYPFSQTQLGLRFNANTSQLVAQTVTVSNLSVNNKIAVKWGNGNYSLYQNGSKIYNQAITSTPIGLYKLNFSSVTETAEFVGSIKDLKVYNTALTDQELATLTTL